MSDLIVYLPNHGYSDEDPIYVSWLDANYYVSDKDNDSFKLAITAGGAELVGFTETVTKGFVREFDDSAGTSIITGLDHLEGKTVKVTSGGSIVGTEVVSNGSITLSNTVYTYQAGLPYTMKARSMRLAVPQQGGTIQTRIKRVISVTVRYIRSLLGSAGVEYKGTEYLTDIHAAYSTDSADTDPQYRLTQGGFNEDAYVTIVSDDPVPFTALSVVTEVEIK